MRGWHSSTKKPPIGTPCHSLDRVLFVREVAKAVLQLAKKAFAELPVTARCQTPQCMRGIELANKLMSELMWRMFSLTVCNRVLND